MNLLTDYSPDEIKVGGFIYKPDSSFCKWVKYIIAVETGDTEKINTALYDIFGKVKIPKRLMSEFIEKTYEWMFPEKNTIQRNDSKGKAYDFEEDGNIIYTELWQYFPQLMREGFSWHEGVELIRLLINKKDTELHHRAFARIGNFSRLSKEERKYWNEERIRLKLSDKRSDEQKQRDFDNAMSGFF